jgi:hypothetical protein
MHSSRLFARSASHPSRRTRLRPLTLHPDIGFGQGEGVVVVLQQDDAVLSGFQSEVLVLLRADLVWANVVVPVHFRVSVEEPQPHSDGEEVVKGSVDVMLCDLALPENTELPQLTSIPEIFQVTVK